MHDHLDHSVMATVISSQHRSLSRFSGASKSVVGLVLMKSWLFFSIGRIHVASQEYFVELVRLVSMQMRLKEAIYATVSQPFL